jgi:hypothetical protein
MLDGQDLSTTCPTKKLEDKHFSPFKVLEQIGTSTFCLELPQTWKKIHNSFHESKLLPYISPKFPQQVGLQFKPPPKLVDGNQEFQVEEVLDSRIIQQQLQYLIKWVGYGSEDNTWELMKHLTNALDSITDFHQHHPNAVSAKTLLNKA